MSDHHQTRHESLLNHVVLPRHLPQLRSSELHSQELELLMRMVQNVESLAESIPANTLKMICSLAEVHRTRTASTISNKINDLKPGETFAMFIRRQNCAIMIHLPFASAGGTNDAIVATFPGKINHNEIYENSSDLEFNYPTQAIKVKNSEMLRSIEFAHQLCFLYETDPKTKGRDYISKWLVTVLMNENSTTPSEQQFPSITKKIRDEVLGEPKNHFRRSGFYMCVKVMLQHNLTHEIGHESAKILYKIIMLQFLSRQCDFFNEKLCKTLNIDLVTQLMAKMARRIEKLSEMEDGQFKELKERIIRNATNTIQEARLKVDKQIECLESTDAEKSLLTPLVDINFEAGVFQRVPKLRAHLKDRINGTSQGIDTPALQVKTYKRHYMKQPNPPSVCFGQFNDEIDKNLFITDFENWILYELKIDETHYGPNVLREWCLAYVPQAESFYKGDQLGVSKSVLVALKMLAMLDEQATKAHSMLLEHNSGVNTQVIDTLLLPHTIDMQIAYELEQYFNYRNLKGTGPSLIGERNATVNSFSHKYAANNFEMQSVRRDIEAMIERKIDEKMHEWLEGRSKVKRLRARAANLEHEYVNLYDSRYHCKMPHHCSSCVKCSLQKQAENVNINVYERALPDQYYEKNAVVFELKIPLELACLRDTLHIFVKYCNDRPTENLCIKGNWIKYSQISHHNRSSSIHVDLGSTTPNIEIKCRHVDNDFSDFNLKNGFNCTYHSSHGGIAISMIHQSIKQRCTLQVEREYKCLQWTLNTTHHTQNQVLTNQSDCPQNLSLLEFKNFGSLRADGHRLQWRKLYAMIECEAMSFENSSVLSLILQTIWETDISGNSGAIRESLEDIKILKLSHKMIELLEKFAEKKRNNWVHPLKLLVPVFIAVRIFELNDDENLAEKIVAVLNKMRTIALEWMDKIQQAIKEMQNPDQAIETELRTKLIFVAVTGALTFCVNSHHKYFDKIFLINKENNFTSSRTWLQSIVTLNNNIILNHNDKTLLPLNLRMFLRLVRNTGIHLESKVREMIKRDTGDIYKLIKKQWTRAENGKFEKFYFHESCPQVLIVEVTVKAMKKFVTIDLITGSFLVNNLPICRLPDAITKSDIFQRVYGNFVFEVQPENDNSYSTVQRYNGNCYEFTQTTKGIIITERGVKNENELIPPSILNGEIPELLIEQHSQWWNRNNNKIEFRPKLFKNKNFSKDIGIEYQLDLFEYHLFHLKTRRNMLDITSKSYLKIVKQLSRLERQRYIHVLMDEPKIAKIELVRMQLKFKVDCSKHHDGPNDILSNEFSKMRVSLQQKCGTLFGLNHGLLLEGVSHGSDDDSKSTKLLLLPNGEIQVKQCDSHVTVNIDIQSELRSPPFYAYQVDEFCKQLKPNSNNYSAWFYLAHLHAVTSHGEIEPFIGMSGTERALKILQSGCVFSSAPYDEVSLKTLTAIAKLSPKRKTREKMLSVSWPKFVFPKSAQDTFVFIVNKLLEDSERLSGLYDQKHDDDSKPTINTNMIYNKRDYLRCLPLTPNLRISGEYINHDKLSTSLVTIPPVSFERNTQNIVISYHKESYFLPSGLDLKYFVMKTSDHISGPLHILHVKENFLNHMVTETFDDLWISMYEICRKQKLNCRELALIWSLLSHEKNHVNSILALQAIYENAHAFALINPPDIATYYLNEGTYSDSRIRDILKDHHTRSTSYHSEDWSDKDRKKYDDRIKSNISSLVSIVTSEWPCDSVRLYQYSYYSQDININAANEIINNMLLIWNNNRRLGMFLDQVESQLQSLPRTSIAYPHINVYLHPKPKNWSKYDIDFRSKVHQSLDEYKSKVEEAKTLFQTGRIDSHKTAQDLWSIYDKIVNSEQWPHLLDAGLYPRTVPTMVLPMLISNETDNRLKMIIGALALTIAKEQRQKRIEIFSQDPQLKPAYEREIENDPHVNWKPHQRPEWLLFEIEQNLTIRRIQIEIARRMLNPPNIGTKHSTMQLNMGEGKTAVIVPLLAIILANGNQACQVTVLKPLYATNLKSLRRYLGGMLNRKVYNFPCRRDMPINEYISQIRNIYEECKIAKGVILTLPEYRLSFQLKIYESVKRGEISEAGEFLAAHKWINSNVRSILDESDAILHAKYQLIYTVGNQLMIDGGSQRWLVTQALLKHASVHMKSIYEKYGEKVLEFNIDYVKNGHVYGAPKIDYRNDVFTPCRILDQSIYPMLKEALIDDFLEGRMNITFPEVLASTKKGLHDLMSATNIDEHKYEATLKDLDVTEQRTILILSGLLRFEVLRLVLTKRWRVNYGVKENGSRKMAIPFKAKDVAAENTEFGHPDVAICFTQLSYYYSGLSDVQMYETFRILAKTQNASAVYEKWITNIASQLIDSSIETYSGINLSDPVQREGILFPLFRFNMDFIDFFLSNVVFPREAKSFENKLICTAWDLVNERMKHTITGFSGTNDTKKLLPLPISQNDLKELEDTNDRVRQTLLQPENQDYEHLPPNVSATTILKRLVDSEIPILLDSGALMLELNNKQVAEEWLKMASDSFYDAAVYFDSNDVLQTIDHNDLVAEFDCSVYRENLDRCLIYLDDTHTRGTDLKFPLGLKACVTLSGEITRDKTVQACMRMRQLGKGHSIAFWASFEADLRIRETCQLSSLDQVTNENVVDFICRNSANFETENTVHWAAAGYNYAKKLAAHKLYENTDSSMQQLYENCVENEFLTLHEMYGDKKTALLTDISKSKFSTLFKQYKCNENVRNFIERIDDGVVEKLQKQVPDVKRFVHSLDEEQEKELEHEIEEERQVERPPKLSPATPSFEPKLKSLILNGANNMVFSELKQNQTLVPFAATLMKTKLFEVYKDTPNWAVHLFVTKDFTQVLANSTDLCDEFLRPIWWIARVDGHIGTEILILLSSYECDRLLTTFRNSTKSTLYMFRPTLSKLHSDLLIEPDLRVSNKKVTHNIELNDSAQIKMFSGSMYFSTEAEQNAYCNFMGLIPRPRTREQEIAFDNDQIRPNGFVPVENRHSIAISKFVERCNFEKNPADLAIDLIEAHHAFMRKESHADSILKRGTKLPINPRNKF
ncbi:uncharacterized protein LOC116339677 [Contarinia nasturtii]|uniref:uncharacterized protein LOC116339677 n=1 Tax=Contarinia nasturtii TaxID=265458 RepID=UPI0012D3DD98|nr:uncharacterized protein LOC116339677 [Contarinia nasturtii]